MSIMSAYCQDHDNDNADTSVPVVDALDSENNTMDTGDATLEDMHVMKYIAHVCVTSTIISVLCYRYILST